MANPKQIAANRQNALRSTGPRTAKGKVRSSMNALKTAVFARHILLVDDDIDEFNRFRAALYDEWRPLGACEHSQLERLVALLWRQPRFYRAESGLYSMYRQCPEGLGGIATALAKDGQQTEAFIRVLRM